MTSIRDIDRFMSEWAGRELSESWDNDGVMLCEDLDKRAEKILVCLEINEKVAESAVFLGCDLIITHHPFIFHPLKNICENTYRLVSLLLKNGISVLSYHTRLDAAHGGVNDVLAKTLGLENVSVFAGLGRVGDMPFETDVQGFCTHVKQRLGCETLRVSHIPQNKKIKRVAVLGGAGKDFIPDASEVADAYVTGDISHSAFIAANEKSLLAVDAGHYGTENPVVEKISSALAEKFSDVSLVAFDSGCPYTQI